MKKKNSSLLRSLKRRRASIFAEILLLVVMLMCTSGGKPVFAAGAAAFLIHSIYLVYVFVLDSKSLKCPSTNPLLSGMTLDFVTNINKPVVIINKSNIVSWYNDAFIKACGAKSAIYGKNITEEISHALNAARLFRDKHTVFEMTLENVPYEVSSHIVTSAGKEYCILLWDDISELSETKALLDSKNVLVAFIIIDNFSEAMQSVQDKSRTAAAIIGSELDSWSASIGGIIKEYDRDKYLLIFEKSNLEALRENKFDILDTLRNISIDEVAMQFTASIGLASVEGTLAEKEAASRACVDLALQRGGDQAVVKIDSTMEFYGGRSQTVQKKTKVRSRVVANELCSLIKQCSNVIVMGHKYADHDCVASSVAVARVAKHLGKQVNIVVNIHDFNLKAIFNSLRGNKEYTDLFIDREYAQELMRAGTLLVVCDVNNVKLFEVPEIYEAASNVVIIDHHRKIADFENEPKIAYIEPAASSVSELMSEILEQVLGQGELPPVEANLILSGIILDTKQFTKNTGVRTFGAALYLRSEGASPYEAQKLFRTSVEDFMRESQFENNIHVYRDCIAISTFEGKSSSGDRIVAAKAADRLLTIEGVSTSFVLCTIDDEISISARSDGNVNVQLVLEALGGGGHFDAAGAQIKDMTMREVLEKLKESIDAFLDA